MANVTWSTTDKTAGVTLTGSNLIATASGASNAVRASDRQVTGKFYWETTLTTASSLYGVGCANAGATLASLYATPSNAIVVYTTGAIWRNNVNTGLTLGSLAAGGVVLCIALDLTSGLFWARSGAAGNWNGNASANPATGILGLSIAAVGGNGIPLYPAACFGVAAACTANFGDAAFTGAVPSGFTAGFTAGASIPLNAVVTQVSAEHWAAASPDAAVTQALVEHWGTVDTITTQAVVTQVVVEHWATAAAAARPRRVVCVSG
jgi:hypothetical protein